MLIGTPLAFGLQRLRSRFLDGFVFVPMIIPDIVLAIALLSAYNLVFTQKLGRELGLWSIVLAHATFGIAFVAIVVRTRLTHFDPATVEASLDLGANEVRTFLDITLPQIAPGVIAGGLIVFTLSFDEFVIAFFTAGNDDHVADPDLLDDPLRRDPGRQRAGGRRARGQLRPRALLGAAAGQGDDVSDDLIRIEGVTRRFGSVVAVDGVTLAIRENEFFGLLGPSGCGKTTLLRILAGFERPDEGRILLDDADLTRTKPYRRPVNMMFQSYALFPHMTVERNVAYGLRMEGVGKREALARAHEALELVQLSDLAKRRPVQLSGGQEQRVALARALVKRPRVLLLDEPLSALDRQIRAEMQIELKLLQHSVGITFVVVTHDQEEALTMADRIAVMNGGRVEQVGAPDELYDAPQTTFVARFIGDSNLFPGTVGSANGAPALVSGESAWGVTTEALARAGLAAGASGAVLVRPERLRLAPSSSPGDVGGMDNVVSGTLIETVFLGAARKHLVEVAPGRSLHVRSASDERIAVEPGARVVVGWTREAGVVVAAD